MTVLTLEELNAAAEIGMAPNGDPLAVVGYVQDAVFVGDRVAILDRSAPEVDDALPGGLAIYGKRFGRYLLDPTLIFVSATGAQ